MQTATAQIIDEGRDVNETSEKVDFVALAEELGPRFAERAAAHDAEDRFVAENFADLEEHRFFSALVPTELGGGGASHAEMCEVLRILGRHCGSTALSLSMHQHLVAATVWKHLNGKPGRELLEKIAADELGLVSTGATDWVSSNGTVEKVVGGYRVSGRKVFASGSPAAAIMVTSAPYEDPTEGWQVLHFGVPFAAEGVTIGDDWKVLGMRGTGSNTVELDGVFVPEEAISLRRPRGEWHMVWNVVLGVALPLICSVYVGVAESAAAIARSQGKRRQHDPAVPYLLGELTNELTQVQLAGESMVRLSDDYRFTPSLEITDALLVRKTLVAEATMRTVQKAMEAAGGAGYYRFLGLERILRDSFASHYHPLPAKKQHVFSGRVSLGLDPVAQP